MSRRAVFLDRDGVLIEDTGSITTKERVHLLDGVPRALRALKSAGYLLLIVSNQTVVSRGLLDEKQVLWLQEDVEALIRKDGGPRLDGFYFCPHHPHATLAAYRVACTCRKPAPGLLLTAAAEHGVSLQDSFMVGDRISDVMAGKAAGCTTILLETGKHADPLIESTVALDESIQPDFRCPSLFAAAAWIVSGT